MVAALKIAAAMEVSNPEDVSGWDRQAEAIRRMLDGDAGLADSVPHFVWHYLADSDIRRKDTAYRATQIEKLLEVISVPF
ncbi:MAG TPA: hypothetical protein VKC56_05610 [Gallionellaceae bacterium]|nr:hypothetical protein [Gallionellaceae bacterium]